jgi:transposase-like protein
VHGVRWSLAQVWARERALLAEDLRQVYLAEDRREALQALERLKATWGSRYPGVVACGGGSLERSCGSTAIRGPCGPICGAPT